MSSSLRTPVLLTAAFLLSTVAPRAETLLPGPDITIVAPSFPVDFGQVFVGAQGLETIIVKNEGDMTLDVSSVVADPPEFGVNTITFSLPPGDSTVVILRFTPSVAGVLPGTLTIVSNDPDEGEVVVPLVGEGLDPPVIGVTPPSLSVSLLTDEVDTRTLTVSNSGAGDLEWTAEVEFLTSPGRTYELRRAGNASLGAPDASPGEIVQATLSDLTGVHILWDRSHSQPSSLSWNILTQDLEARGATVVTNFDPISEQVLQGVDILWSQNFFSSFSSAELNALAAWYATGGAVLLEGDSRTVFNQILTALSAGIQVQSPFGTSGATSNVATHPTTLGVATVELPSPSASLAVDSTATTIVSDTDNLPIVGVAQNGGRVLVTSDQIFQNGTISAEDNQLLGNQVIDWLAGARWLSLDLLAGTVPAGESRSVAATFDATNYLGGTYTAEITFLSNDPAQSEILVPVDLTVTGVPALLLSESSLSFGEVLVGGVELRVVQLTNVGTADLDVTGVTASPAEFGVADSSFVVPPYESFDLTVTFSPTSAAAVNGDLTILSNDPANGTIVIPLAGIGLDPPVATLSPDSLDLALLSGEIALTTFQLMNQGGSDLVWAAAIEFEASPFTLTVPSEVGVEQRGEEGPLPPARTEAIAGSLQDLTGVRVLWDRSRGQLSLSSWSTIVADLELRGAVVEENSDPLTPALLEDYDVFWSEDFFGQWSASEITALRDWVLSGGGLILEGGSASSAFNEILSQLGTGIQFPNTRFTYEATSNVFPHPTTEDIQTVYIDYGREATVLAPGETLVDDSFGAHVVAAADLGLGRVFASGSFLFSNSLIGQVDNQLFGNQVLDWLAGPRWLSVAPTSGTLVPAGLEILEATVDATGLPGGDYSANVVLTTNDPQAPTLTVAVDLAVTASPDISVGPTSIAFGSVFVGGMETREVTVENEGTADLNVTSVAANPWVFGATPSAFVLSAGQSQVVSVTFTPDQAATSSGQLKFVSDDPDESIVLVALTGEGLDPPVAEIPPTAIDVDLLAGMSVQDTITVANTGFADLEWTVSTAFGATRPTIVLTDPPENPTLPEQEGDQFPLAGGRTEAVYATLADLSGVRVLWEQSHGQSSPASWSALIADLEQRGATLDVNSAPLTGAVLADYDLLWVTDGFNWTHAEAETVAVWLSEDGGNLLLEGDSSLSSFNLILDAAGAGITYLSSSGFSGSTTNVHPHPTTIDVESVVLSSPNDRLAPPLLPAVALVDDSGGIPIIQASELPAARIIACSDEVFADFNISGGDTQLFGNQAIDWLVGPGWLDTEPRTGTVPPGQSQPVVVTLDAGGLVGGEYEADLLFATNDPLALEVPVPVTLTVTDVPDIVVDPTSLDFGTVFTGSNRTLALDVANEGTIPLNVSNITTAPLVYIITPLAFSVDVGQSRPVFVTFAPNAVGDASGALTISSDDPDQPELVIPLLAQAVDPPDIAVSPGLLQQDLVHGQSAVQTVTIENTGVSELVWDAFPTFLTSARVVASSPRFTSDARYGKGPHDVTPDLDLFRAEGPTPIELSRNAGLDPVPSLDSLLVSVDSTLAQISMAIPNRFDFSGGVFGSSISDGGFDMYDNGNILNTNLGTFIPYSDGVILTDARLGSQGRYFTRKGTGVFLFAADLDGVSTFQITGGLGADGLGVADGVVLEATVAGQSFTGFVKRVHGVSEPSVNHLVIIESAAGAYQSFSTNTNEDFHEVGGLQSTDRLYYLLFAGANGFFFEDSEVLHLFETFVEALGVGPGWLSVAPESGVLPPGGSQDLAVTFDATELFEGDYSASIAVASNDPDEPTFLVETELHVRGEADLTVPVSVVNFGPVFVGGAATEVITVRNDGAGTLEITELATSPPDFSVSPTSASVAPEQTLDVSVTLTPVQAGALLGDLTFTSNDPNDPEIVVPLTGLGVDPPDVDVTPVALNEALLTNETSTRTVTVGNVGSANLEFTISAAFADSLPNPDPTPPLEEVLEGVNAAANALSATIPDRFDFFGGESGSGISDGGSDMYDFGNRLRTNLGGDLAYSDDTIVLQSYLGPGGRYFTRKIQGMFIFAADLDSVQSFEIYGGLGADGFGSVDGAVLTANTGGRSFTGFVKRVFGASNPSVNHLVIVESDPAVSHEFPADTDSDLHTVLGLGSVNRLYYLLYAGANGAYIDDAATQHIFETFLDTIGVGPPWIDVEPGAGVVEAGGSLDLTVTFDAGGLFGGTYDSDLILLSNDPDEPIVEIPTTLVVTGVPDIAVSPLALDFGEVFVGGSVVDSFTVDNVGTDSLTVTVTTPTDYGAAPEDFTVPAMTSQTVVVTFAPTVAGTNAGDVTLSSNDPDEPTLPVAVTGIGLDPPVVAIDPLSFSFDLVTGEVVADTLAVSNTGSSDLDWQLRIRDADGPQRTWRLTAPEPGSGIDPEGNAVVVPAATGRGAITAGLQDLTGFRVAYDRSHGQFPLANSSLLAADLEARGAEVFENFEILTPQVLSDWDALWTTDCFLWTEAELTAVSDWVRAGGSLLIESDESVTNYDALLSTMEAGIVLSSVNGFSGASSNVFPHPTTEGVGTVYFSGPLASVESVTPPATEVGADLAGRLMVAASEPQSGRVFVTADEIFTDFAIGSSDNQLLGNQVFDWLAGPAWVDAEPAAGTVPPASTQDVTITVDATGLLGGTYSAVLELASNDPVTPLVSVPIDLTVTGAPDIAVSETSLDFSAVFLGASVERMFVVTNEGTDLLTVTGIAADLPDYAAAPPSFTVAIGESQDVVVTFAPQGAGTLDGTLTIQSDDPDEPEVQITVTGEGVEPPDIAVSPTSLQATLVVDEMIVQALTVENEGLSDLTFTAFARLTAGLPMPGAWLQVRADAAAAAGPASSISTRAEPDALVARYEPRPAAAQADAVRDRRSRSNGRAATSPQSAARAAGGDSSVVVLFADDFESGQGNWTHYVTAIGPDLWALSSARSVSGMFSWNVAPHSAVASEALQSPAIDLRSVPDAWLSFSHFHAFDDCNNPDFEPDGGLVEISTDGGSSWAQIEPEGGYPYVIDINCGNPFELREAFAHDTGGLFVPALFDLTAWVGNEVAIRFHAGWDCGNCAFNEGWYIDDVTVFTSAPAWLALSTGSGVVTPGGSETIDVTFDATGLAPDTYLAEIVILSNDPDEPEVVVPVELVVQGGAATEVAGAGLPRRHALHQNHPNPFRPRTTIAFELPVESRVRLEIYDVTGRLVATVRDESLPPGRHAARWDGRDHRGRRVSSGVYFYRLVAGEFVATKRMIRMH